MNVSIFASSCVDTVPKFRMQKVTRAGLNRTFKSLLEVDRFMIERPLPRISFS